jgi:MacB-like periplasmic core domain
MKGNTSVTAWLAVVVATTVTTCAPVQQYPEPPAGSYSSKRFTLAEGDGKSAVVDGAEVSSEFFAAAGAKPLLGRLFVDQEYAGTAATRVALVSHRCWEERFGSAPSLIGRVLDLDDRSRTVVGVLPRGFDVPQGTCVWLPGVTE